MPTDKPSDPSKNTAPGLAARRVACDLMTSVTEDGVRLSELLPSAVEKLDISERARAQRLATEALRWAGRCDRMLGKYVKRRPEDRILNLLRLSLWEIFGDEAAAHGVVHSAVTLARESNPKAAGMVNAVLRNILRNDPNWSELPVPTLPKTLRKPLIAAWGKDAVGDIEEVHAKGASLDITTKSGASTELSGETLPTGSIRISGSPQVSSLPGYASGEWWVQDAAAALPVKMAGDIAGKRVLDLCAAPGGKTMQLADAGAKVTALDISKKRLVRVQENLDRTRLAADLVAADAFKWEAPDPYDVVLLDAPCSATGTIRRHPDLPFVFSQENLKTLIDLQAKLIDRALEFLRPGGTLIYCTCSLLPAEGEDQVAKALERYSDVTLNPMDFAGLEPDWLTQDGMLRLRPDFWADKGGMDGFFAASLQKPA